ncbi:MAG: hemolysin family protein [Bacteroidetes bacterium]|nr:hemolysin family protein [Bacteroidota bacterium]
MDDPFLYGLLILLLLLFLILKSAFSAINPLQLEVDKKKHRYHFRILHFISQKIIEFSVVVNICYFITLALLIYFAKNDLYFISNVNTILYLIIFVVSIGLLVFPVISILPKTIGEYFSNNIINALAIPLIVIYILFFPIIKIILFLSNAPFKILYNEDITLDQKLHFNKDDLNKFVSDSEKHTSNNEDVDAEVKLFKNALEFSEIKIRECMIPRTEIVAVELNQVETEIREKFVTSGHSKVLVYRNSIENIIGYIKSKSLFYYDDNLKQNIKSISYFPESMPANKLLRYFIRSGHNIAVVVDEFGGTSGIITIEDILEEIFGEIQDEHDNEDLYEKKLTEHDYIFSGRIEIDYLNEKYNLKIPESEEYETIAGFILFHTESLPNINDQITIENFKIGILKVSNTRLELVKLEILAEHS